ncbi:hypothetical protein BKA93DRAFT_830357 [Sparassis latifolia]
MACISRSTDYASVGGMRGELPVNEYVYSSATDAVPSSHHRFPDLRGEAGESTATEPSSFPKASDRAGFTHVSPALWRSSSQTQLRLCVYNLSSSIQHRVRISQLFPSSRSAHMPPPSRSRQPDWGHPATNLGPPFSFPRSGAPFPPRGGCVVGVLPRPCVSDGAK